MDNKVLKAKISKKIFIVPLFFGGIFLIESIVFTSLGGTIGMFPLIIAILIIAPAVIKYFYTNLILSSELISGETGLLKKETLNAPLDKINGIYISKGIFGRLFGYGNINISTSSNNFSFKGISNCEEFKDKVFEKIEKYKQKQAEEQAKLMAEAIKNVNK